MLQASIQNSRRGCHLEHENKPRVLCLPGHLGKAMLLIRWEVMGLPSSMILSPPPPGHTSLPHSETNTGTHGNSFPMPFDGVLTHLKNGTHPWFTTG